MPLLLLSGVFLLVCGTFAIAQAATGQFLPHDAVYLGMTAPQLCALEHCRIVHFMIHDRMSFGGVLIAIGVLYLWLAHVPLRQRESWAWWALALSGTTGFLSFLAYLGYGYLDRWHGAATLVLLPMFVTGLARTRGLRQTPWTSQALDLGSTPAAGRALLLLASIGIIGGGLAITIVGMTRVFVPQDLTFMGTTPQALRAINPHLVPLIAHDRAGFGGALVSFGVAMLACVRYARLSPGLLRILAIAGIAGFGTSVGVHLVIGYTSLLHLGPAVLGGVVFAAGLVVSVVPRDFRLMPHRSAPGASDRAVGCARVP
jgi:hypothetical protein